MNFMVSGTIQYYQIKSMLFLYSSYGKMKGRNPKQKSMNEIKTKYGCDTLKSKGKYKIAS